MRDLQRESEIKFLLFRACSRLFLIVYVEGKINGFRNSIEIDLFGAHDSICNWDYRAALPPLTGIDAPLRYEALSEATKRIASAISSGRLRTSTRMNPASAARSWSSAAKAFPLSSCLPETTMLPLPVRKLGPWHALPVERAVMPSLRFLILGSSRIAVPSVEAPSRSSCGL